MTAGVKDDVSINAVASFTEGSIDLRGSGLWTLAMYGSQNMEGTGDQFQRVEQTLSSSQQSQSLSGGNPITFSNAKAQIDVVAIGCNEYGYICFDFMQGDNPNPDYTFRTRQDDPSKFTVCEEKDCDAGEYKVLIRDSSRSADEKRLQFSTFSNFDMIVIHMFIYIYLLRGHVWSSRTMQGS